MKTINPAIVSGGLVVGHTEHLLNLHNHYVDNNLIEPDKKIDFYIHTWDIKFNLKYLESLQKRYSHKYNFIVQVEDYEAKFLPVVGNLISKEDMEGGHWKSFLLAYSLWKAFHLIRVIDEYDHILKYKFDIISTAMPWGISEQPSEFFKNRSIHGFPTLYNYNYNDCFYAQHIHDGFDERHFVTFPGPIKKLFLCKTDIELLSELKQICLDLFEKYGIPLTKDIPWRVQGTVMWGEWLKRHNIPYINVQNNYTGHNVGEISPRFEVKFENNSYIVKDKDNYRYIPWNNQMM